MLLTIDVGNSNIVAGVWKAESLLYSWRIHTVAKKTEDEYGTIFRSLFQEKDLDPKKLRKVCLSSVVPSLTGPMITMVQKITGQDPVVVGPAIYDTLPIKVVNPYEVGADLVADAMAAYTTCQGSCIVVDFGTALTFTIIDATGTMQGVAIAPGLGTAVNALSRDTAQLPYVQLAVPPEPFGRNTVHAIQAGVVYGYTGLVEYMIARIRENMADDDCKVIATGGLCEVIAPLTKVFTYIDKDLTLRGLKLIAECLS
ncbi:MAG: type III pantothenate kinase [Termitinemataceae bacterium]